MVRSIWRKAVVGALAWAGVALGQNSAGERLILVQEANKPPQRCRVLKCWTEKDGSRVCQVQDVATGEQMTIQEATASSYAGANKTVSTHIFHWGQGNNPPKDAPTAPPTAAVVAVPVPAPAAPQPEQGSKSSVLGWFRSGKSGQDSAGKAPATGSIRPVDRTEPRKADTVQVEPASPSDWRQSWGRVERWQPEADKPDPPASPARPTVARKAGKTDSFASDYTPTSRPKPPLAEDRPDDPLKSPELFTPAIPTPKIAAKDARPTQALPVGYSQAPQAGGAASPVYVPGGQAPPGAVQTVPMPAVAPSAPAQAAQAPPAAPRTGFLSGLFSRSSRPAGATQGPVQAGVGADLPPGMGSVVAAGVAPVPAVPAGQAQAVPAANAFTDAQPTGGQAPGGPMPYPAPGYAMIPPAGYPAYPAMPMPMPMPPAMQAAMMQTGIPAGMANAFTPGSTSRPIPADFGPPAYPENAFIHQGAELAAAPSALPRPPMAMYPYAMNPYAMAAAPMPGMAQAPLHQASYAQPVASSTGVMVPALMVTLKDALLPSHREWAAGELGKCDWKREPEVVTALLVSAQTDPAAMVRAGCVRALGKLKVNTVPVVRAVEALKVDPDLRVRQEVEQALAVLLKP